MEKIILVGGGGHCQVVIELIRLIGRYEIVGICDFKEGSVLGVSVIGDDSILASLFASGVQNAFVAFGAIANAHKRKLIFERLLSIGYKLPNLIHPRAYVSPTAVMGVGNFIGINATVNAAVQLKNCCIINSAAIIEHNCEFGDYVHVAPGAIICGNVVLEDSVHVGPGTVILQDVKVSQGVMVGALSLVIKNINTPNIVGYGQPFREVRSNVE